MMTGYSSSKIAVKDNFDDDDASDDVEDEVFIRDGRNGFKVDEEMGVKRPLMAPRRKGKSSFLHTESTKRPFCKRFCVPYCYGMIAIAVIIGFVMGATLFLNLFPSPLYNFRLWSMGTGKRDLAIIPCTEYSGTDIWYKTFPRLKSEVALESMDLNKDNINDVIVGYGTGIEDISKPGACDEFPNSKDICGGGVLALNGKTGETLWQHWTRRDVLFVDCSANVNAEKTNDCLISGKGGVLSIIDGATGNLIWELSVSGKPAVPGIFDIYSAQYISDKDGDGYSDLLVAHTSGSFGQLLVLSGRAGRRIGHFDAPNKQGIYTPPRVIVTKDGSDVVIFATGSFETQGTLYATTLANVVVSGGEKNCYSIWQSDVGVSSGILLADMNNDETEDIIITSGDTLTVIEGDSFTSLWNVSSNGFGKEQRHILIGPTAGYFDDDMVPDLLITHMIGPSYPTYYYSQTWVANGVGGVNLLDEPILGGSEITAPGITVSFNGIGNDMYLFWMTTCNSQAKQKNPFLFARDTTVHQKAHADLCQLRFNKSLEIQMYILNQHIEPPGVLLYSSKVRWDTEHNVTEEKAKIEAPTSPPKTVSRTWAHKDKLKQKIQETEKVLQEIPKSIYDTDEERNVLLPGFPQEPIDDNFMESRESDGNLFLPPGINLGEMAMDYEQVYPQESENEELIPRRGENRRGEGILVGRDERADFVKSRETRSTNKENKNKGLPRATTTAMLDKPLNGAGIDIVFATHWELPVRNVRILSERDERCIRKIVTAAQQSNDLNDMELGMVEDKAENDCLGPEPKYIAENNPTDGQLTVYRINLSCKCNNINPARETCSAPLPIEQQSYSHRAGEVYFKRRRTSPLS